MKKKKQHPDERFLIDAVRICLGGPGGDPDYCHMETAAIIYI